MSMREIAGGAYAGALSEFVSGYNGDCGETAELALLHVLNPAAFPLDGAHLAQITGRDVQRGWASANGAEPLSSIAHDLDVLGVGYVNHGYSEPFTIDWHGALNNLGGIEPMVFELALAQNLPGDEPGLHYHFITCVGWDSNGGVGLFADGDNAVVRAGKSGPSGLVTYTLAQLDASRVCGLLVSTAHVAEPPAPPPPPAPTGYRTYVVQPDDSLSEIAAKLHLNNWFHDLYQVNMAEIEAAARSHGHPEGAHGGNLIFAGEPLHYQG